MRNFGWVRTFCFGLPLKLILVVQKIELFDTHKYFPAAADFRRYFKIEADTPNLDLVVKYLQAFTQLPYENLTKIIKLNHQRDNLPYRFPEEILADFEAYHLGGTCFSLTYYLKTILDYSGFDSYIVMADMPSGANTHCALILTLCGEELLLDPGYLIHRPLTLNGQPTEEYNLTFETNSQRYTLWTRQHGKLKKRYSFKKSPTPLAEFIRYWDASFHWMTMHGICLSRRSADGYIYLHNHYLKQERATRISRGNFDSAISEMVSRYFQIPPQIVTQAETALRQNLEFDKERGLFIPSRRK